MSDTTHPASGRFVLRIAPALHAALRQGAERADLSLNEYCSRRLAQFDAAGALPFAAALERCFTQGDAVLAVLVFGSWARGEAGSESDIDLLVVLDSSQRLDRSLYRPWDDAPLEFEGHRIEPHYAHLPAPGERISSLWAEVAVDGVMLLDTDLAVGRRLAAIRREILSGRLVRRQVNGQSYWVHAA